MTTATHATPVAPILEPIDNWRAVRDDSTTTLDGYTVRIRGYAGENTPCVDVYLDGRWLGWCSLDGMPQSMAAATNAAVVTTLARRAIVAAIRASIDAAMTADRVRMAADAGGGRFAS